MKTLITAAEVIKRAENHEIVFPIQADSIITPSAKDTAQDRGIQFIIDSGPSPNQNETNSPDQPVEIPFSPLDPAVIAKVIGEVMLSLNTARQSSQLVKKVDPCGLRLVKGTSVVLENYNTGHSQDNVKIKELFNFRESSHLSAGFMRLKETSYSLLIMHDEFHYIIDGTLECCVNGRTYCAEPGDTLFLPANTEVTFAASHIVKLLYVTSLSN